MSKRDPINSRYDLLLYDETGFRKLVSQIRIEVNFMELKFWSRNKAHILAPEIKDYSALQCSNPGLKLPFLILSFTALFRAGTKTTDFDIL